MASSQYITAAIATIVALLLVAVGWHYHRVNSTVAWLDTHQAKYEWYYDVPNVERVTWRQLQLRIAPVVGGAVISDIYTVKLTKSALSDDDLVGLESLVNLKKLTLDCDLATDETLVRIARLQKLQSLTLGGGNYTFEGLLQLRKLPRLRYIHLNNMQLSMAELAVLESAVPVANLKYNQQDMHHPYEREVASRYPRNKPSTTIVEVGFEPLIPTGKSNGDGPARFSAG